MTEQTYCDRLVQDTPFLMGHGRLSEQQVDKIILQLNRYYPQILSNKDAEKFRNPKASLRVRLCDLLGHLQRSNERDCQEFYRALYIHAQPLHRCLPSRRTLQISDCTELDSGTASHELSDRGPMAFLACLGLAAGLALLIYCCPSGRHGPTNMCKYSIPPDLENCFVNVKKDMKLPVHFLSPSAFPSHRTGMNSLNPSMPLMNMFPMKWALCKHLLHCL